MIIIVIYLIHIRRWMIAKNKNLQESLLVLLILILPASIYTYAAFTAQSPQQAFAGNTQGGTQGFSSENLTGRHNNPSTVNGDTSKATATTGNPNTATVNGNSSTASDPGTNSKACVIGD